MSKKNMIIALLSLLFISACSTQVDVGEESEIVKPKVVVSLFPQYEFVKWIAEDTVELQMLLPSGVEPHSFEPSPSVMIDLYSSDLLIFTNALMEPWIQRLVDNLGSSQLKLIDSSLGIELIEHFEIEEDDNHDDDDDDDHLGEDPHIWLDPLNAIQMALNIRDALIEINPEQRSLYESNTLTLLEELNSIARLYDEVLLETDHKTIIYGGHFAFGYLANRYGLNILSPYEGFSPDAEPSPSAIASLIQAMDKYQIKIIFYEELVDPKSARVIAEQTGAAIELLHGGHNLSQDEWNEGLTYFTILRENAEKLSRALTYE